MLSSRSVLFRSGRAWMCLPATRGLQADCFVSSLVRGSTYPSLKKDSSVIVSPVLRLKLYAVTEDIPCAPPEYTYFVTRYERMSPPSDVNSRMCSRPCRMRSRHIPRSPPSADSLHGSRTRGPPCMPCMQPQVSLPCSLLRKAHPLLLWISSGMRPYRVRRQEFRVDAEIEGVGAPFGNANFSEIVVCCVLKSPLHEDNATAAETIAETASAFPGKILFHDCNF